MPTFVRLTCCTNADAENPYLTYAQWNNTHNWEVGGETVIKYQDSDKPAAFAPTAPASIRGNVMTKDCVKKQVNEAGEQETWHFTRIGPFKSNGGNDWHLVLDGDIGRVAFETENRTCAKVGGM